MTHPRWRELQSLLMREATDNGIRLKTDLAERLEINPSKLNRWIARRVMPSRAHLQYLSDMTGNAAYKQLRPPKREKSDAQ